MSVINNFTFFVVTYNHSNYILEHLESIKYLMDHYGDGIDVDIIVADDGSRDDTVALSKFWLSKNSHLFKEVTVLSDGINRGTCKNLTLALENLTTDYCKLTAGDDIYSYENLFLEAKKLDCNHIISGLPLNLINGTLMSTRFDLFNLFATNIIYKKSQYMTRLKRINFFNSPSIMYAAPALLNKDVTDFVNRYSVTEDYPMQIKMAELYKPLKYLQVEKIFVYYRRTANSTYIVKGSEFNRDKLKIFDYLIKSEKNIFGQLLLRNRLFCYTRKNKYVRKLLNLNFYLYGFCVLRDIVPILNKFKSFDAQLTRHQNHHDLIVSRAQGYHIPPSQTL